jgi:acido-empty-quinoprotein group A
MSTRSTRSLMPLLALVALAAGFPWSEISGQKLDPSLLAKPPAEAWPTYHGDYSGRHYSPLTQINAGNVAHLSLAWVHRLNTSPRGAITGSAGTAPPAGDQGIPIQQIKAIPLMVDGVLYFSVPNHAYAVDARTGKEAWHYYWKSDRSAIGNRGMGMYGGWLYFETPDNHVISLDAATGAERWRKQIASVRQQYFSTPAPIVIRNHVIVGMGGDALDVPAWLEARDPDTGEIQWKWYTTPRAGEPGIETWPNEQTAAHGGGMPWQPPTYDPELNLLYVPTGNPNPVLDGRRRPGDNLYTASIVALDVDTGRMKWHFQGSPHDTHDWDGTQVPVLFDAEIDGKPRKLLAQANRNGFFFVLDRITGQNLVSKPFATTANWFTGINAKGQPIPNAQKEPQIPGALVSPSTDGAANYPAPSFSPDTGLFYVNATESWSIYYLTEKESNAVGWGGASEYHTGVFDSVLRALDYRTGEVRWEHKYEGLGFWSSTYPGMLSTAGGLLFTGDPAGNFIAYDPASGKVLWHSNLGSIVCNSPITYMLDGRQYIVVASGDTLYAFSLYETFQKAQPDVRGQGPQPDGARVQGGRGSGTPEGFTSIFNGRDLTGWHVSRTTHQGSTPDVRVEDGVLVLKQHPYGQGGLLLTDKRYRNFELYLEARPDWGCNGGIVFRSTEGGSAYQIELDQANGTGNLFGDMLQIGKLARAADIDTVWKYDEWNRFRLRVAGEAPRMQLWINDVLMWDVVQEKNDLVAGRTDGMIGLQVHWTSATAPPVAPCCARSWKPGGAHRYRNLAIRELD